MLYDIQIMRVAKYNKISYEEARKYVEQDKKIINELKELERIAGIMGDYDDGAWE
jgi:hypothetical protein